jgi:YD repeat-containing protein
MAASSLSVGGGAQGQTSVSRQNASSGGVIDPISSAQNGGLGYNFTFNIPPGRSGMTPSLNLSYSSQSFDDSGFGYGWALSTPYIQRYNKSGFDNLYSTSSPSTDFYSSLSGEIVPSGSLNGYIARNDDGSNLQYTFASNAWSVIDKNGTTYQYGPTSASQQTDSGGSGKIFKWMLQKMTDSNGNSVTYSYTKDLGQIYPSGITYTDTATTTGVFAVNFTLGLEATSTATSSAVGFPVKNRYQVNQITVLTNGTTTRTFTLTFGPGDNGSRTILKGITETGQSLTGSLALPPTSFSYSTSSPAFATSTNITLGATTQINGNDRGVAFADFNGDSVPDIIEAREQRASDGVTVLVNDKVAYVRLGDGSATTSTSYTPPCAFTWDNGTIPPTIPIQDAGGRLVDVNGDGLLDFICPTGGYINNGSNWVASSTWNSPVAMTTVDIGGNNVDAGVRFGDVNGDGLIDIIQGVVLSGTYTDKVYINNTHGWTYDPIWSLPTHLKFTGDSGKDGGGRLIDVNGDGLADIYFGSDDSYTATSSVYTNTGHGWTYDPAWILPDNLTATTTGMQFADLNKDGLIDLSIATGTLPYNAPDFSTITWTDNRVYLNTGSGWKRDLTRSIPIPYSVTVGTTTTDTSPRFGNFLNHGLNDLIVSTVFNNSNFYSVVEGVQGNMPDLLNKITESAGNSTSITYQSTSAYKASGTLNFLNPKLPYAFPTVFQITHNDGVSSPYTEWYGYNGGTLYYASTTDHRFGGFASIIKYVGGGDPTIIYFHTGVGTSTSLGEYQDNQAKIGQIYRVETYGAGATSTPLYKVVINKWDSFTRGLGNFAWPVRTTELDYDAKSTHKDIAQEFSYSTTTGNLTQNIDWGEVTAAYDGSFTDVGTDKISAAITYAASSTLPITKPSQVTTTDQSGTTVGGTKYLYDNLAPSLLTKGNLTERDDLKTAPNAFIQSVRSTYNPLGLVTQSIDSRGATTTYSYDPYNLYPATTTNALGHITTATYNYSLGSAAQIIDPNGAITKTLYDPVDRILAILRPDVNATTTLATSTAYIYIDTGMPRLIHETDYLDATNIVNKYIYRDGFSRVIEQRTQAEGTNNYKVEDSYYNFLGLVSSKSLPFLASSVAYTGTSSPPASYLMSYYYYDPLKRIIQSSTYVNYVLHNYGNWVDSTTDTLGKVKDFYTDAYGNLSKVVEHMGTTTATTTYTYDAEKDLTKVTDALGNIRNFTYDTLGRLLKSEDLHSISDTTFGSTTYAYDDNGNITNTVSPRGKSVTYTYDLLNRVNTEDSPDTAYTDVIYTYDTSLHAGKGRLGNVSTAYVSTGYDYDWNGNLLAERHAIPGSATTTTFYYYDRQQNPTYVIYPDNSEVYYGYNTAGLLDYVLDLEAGTTTWRTLVSNFDYSPMDQVTQTQYGNGTASTNTYIPSNLYWLGSRVAYNSIKYFQSG